MRDPLAPFGGGGVNAPRSGAFHDLECYADAWEQEQHWREEYERDQLENPEPVTLETDWPLIAPRPAALIPSDLPF